MKKRDVIFIVVVFCLVIGAALFFYARTDKSAKAEESDLASLLAENYSPRNTQKQADQADFTNKLRERLQLSSDIIEEHTYDLPEMLGSKKIRVLTTFTFGNYFVYEGKAYGYEYSMMEEYRKFLNKNRNRSSQVDFYYFPLPYDLLISALNKGYGDIIAANQTILSERGSDADFTDPYQWNIKELVVSHKDIQGLETIEDLSGRELHIREESSYYFSLKKLNEQLKEKKLAPVKIITLPGLINTGEIIELISSGVFEMTVADSHIASIASELLPDVKMYDNLVINEDVRFGWLVRKNNPQLRESLNQFIKTVKKGTLLGNIYFKRYFKENPWAKEYVQREDLKKFSKYAPLFKKYGEMYDVDWMLVEAQAFQESGLNPDVRSRMGAVGLMQLLPSTASYMGIEDIHLPENNVHAGVKYLRHLMDHYFPEDEFTSTERLRFALAAYNAGPGNIRKSRKKTDEIGYDSTKWFDNTELGTMSQVGLEPVHYVRNINKYYLSFLISATLQDVKEEIKQKRLAELKKKD